jgi:hypothetical protein
MTGQRHDRDLHALFALPPSGATEEKLLERIGRVLLGKSSANSKHEFILDLEKLESEGVVGINLKIGTETKEVAVVSFEGFPALIKDASLAKTKWGSQEFQAILAPHKRAQNTREIQETQRILENALGRAEYFCGVFVTHLNNPSEADSNPSHTMESDSAAETYAIGSVIKLDDQYINVTCGQPGAMIDHFCEIRIVGSKRYLPLFERTTQTTIYEMSVTKPAADAAEPPSELLSDFLKGRSAQYNPG